MAQIALGPHVFHACITAYTEAANTLQSHYHRELSDNMKSTIATTIIELAEDGVENPAVLAQAALAQVGARIAAE